MVSVNTTRLEAVNTMLALIGSMAVNSLDEDANADVALAVDTLEEIEREVQTRGWHWNTDLQVESEADSTGRHVWQDDWIRFDPQVGDYQSRDLVRRGGYIWDRRNGGTNEIAENLKGDVVRFIDWDDIPQTARNFIMKRAARIFLTRTIGDQERAGYGIDDERRAFHAMVNEEAEQADYNVFYTGVAPLVMARPGGTGLSGHSFPPL